MVVDSDPRPGTPLTLTSTVRLLVSAGSRVVMVPDLMTRSLVEAEESLERLGLRLGDVAQDSASLAAPGTVLAQVPDAGTRVSRGTPIAVVVAGKSAR
jgi:serine/threonine-protein kinase